RSSPQHPPEDHAKTDRDSEKRGSKQQQRARENGLRFDPGFERQRFAAQPIAQGLLPHENVAALMILRAGVGVDDVARQVQSERAIPAPVPPDVSARLPRRRPDGLTIGEQITFLAERVSRPRKGWRLTKAPHIVSVEPDVDEPAAAPARKRWPP